jgi:hypothetical protein
MLGSLLAANGESSRAAQGLQDAARIYRTRGEIENAVRAERAVKRLTS